MPDQEKQQAARSGQRQVVLHPLLFAVNFIIFFYVQSFAFVDSWAIVRAATLSLAAAALIWVILRLWLADLHKSALLTSLAFTLFFAYGTVTRELDALGWFAVNRWVPGAHLTLLATMFALWCGVATVVRKYRIPSGLTYFANVMGVVAVILPLMIVGTFTYRTFAIERGIEWKHESLPVAGQKATREPPDIYWILPDAYARRDILAALYDYNDDPFLDALRQRGFTITPKAIANYARTASSVASVLNMDYNQNLVSGAPEDYPDWRLIRRLLNENRLNRFLKAQGYTTHSVEAQNVNVTWRTDERVSRWWFLNDYEAFLLGNTPISPLSRMLGVPALPEHHRARTRFNLDWLAQAADLPGPKFVFVQLVTPHPPFLFGAEGEAVNSPWPYTQAGGYILYQMGATKEGYQAGYLGQLRYISRRLIEMVDQIQARSERPPVIVLLSDHGPDAGEWMVDLSHPEVIERFAVLSALSLPGVPPTAIPEDLSAVNTFRLILNHYFDTKLDLLDPKAYYTIGGQPNRYVPIDFTENFP
jgi:hypothetical protein